MTCWCRIPDYSEKVLRLIKKADSVRRKYIKLNDMYATNCIGEKYTPNHNIWEPGDDAYYSFSMAYKPSKQEFLRLLDTNIENLQTKCKEYIIPEMPPDQEEESITFIRFRDAIEKRRQKTLAELFPEKTYVEIYTDAIYEYKKIEIKLKKIRAEVAAMSPSDFPKQ